MLKDFSTRSWIIRTFWGPFVARREARFLERAQGIDRIPRFLGRVGPCALLMSLLPGQKVGDVAGDRLYTAYLEQLTDLVEALHQRGIARGDLSRFNVMIDNEGGPGLVDFETARANEENSGPLNRWAFQIQLLGDRYQMAQKKAVFAPHLLTLPERSLMRWPRPDLLLVLIWRDQ